MSVELITAFLAIIEQILPLLGTSSATTQTVTAIIQALTKLLPYISAEAVTLYQTIKGIIAALQATDPTPEQIAQLQQLDAQFDAAFEAAAAAVDPDLPGTPTA